MVAFASRPNSLSLGQLAKRKRAVHTMSRAAIKKNQESARDLADTMRKFIRDMGASGIGVDSPIDSPTTFHYATSNDEYKGDDEGEGEDEDGYELDNNFEYIPVNESEGEEKEKSSDLTENKEKNEKENGLEDNKKEDVAEKKSIADKDQQSATEFTHPPQNDVPNAALAVVATTFSSPAPSGKTPVTPTHTPKKRKIPAAMLGSRGSTVTQTTPLRRSSRKKHKTTRYTYPIKEEPVKSERPDDNAATLIADNQVMAHFTRLIPKMVCKHCDEELLASRGAAKKHLESCSGVKLLSRK